VIDARGAAFFQSRIHPSDLKRPIALRICPKLKLTARQTIALREMRARLGSIAQKRERREHLGYAFTLLSKPAV